MNPIWRVVKLLQDVAKENRWQEVALYHTFECYCRGASQELKTNAEEGADRIRETTSKIEAGKGTQVKLQTVIKVSQESGAQAKQAVASSGALDGNAASAFDDESSGLAANIDALIWAIAATFWVFTYVLLFFNSFRLISLFDVVFMVLCQVVCGKFKLFHRVPCWLVLGYFWLFWVASRCFGCSGCFGCFVSLLCRSNYIRVTSMVASSSCRCATTHKKMKTYADKNS